MNEFRWIPVEERVPDNKRDVAVRVKSFDSIYTEIGRRFKFMNSDKETWFTSLGIESSDNIKVISWCELPPIDGE